MSSKWPDEPGQVPIRKRRLSVATRVARPIKTPPEISVNPPPKPGWDSFCFKCHTDDSTVSLACAKCKCSFHPHCVFEYINHSFNKFKCQDCREIYRAKKSKNNKFGWRKIEKKKLAKMLARILDKLLVVPEYEKFENKIRSLIVVNDISLKLIEEKVKTNRYDVSEEFVKDCKQLEHNWKIFDQSISDVLMIEVHTEVNDLEACEFCYDRDDKDSKWFIKPCIKRPHLLVWARFSLYPYWPAKVQAIRPDGFISVQFFGKHDHAIVNSNNCFLFSNEDPNDKEAFATDVKLQKYYTASMKEVTLHIDLLHKAFGFNYASFKVVFNPSDLENLVEAMLPALTTSKANVERDQEIFRRSNNHDTDWRPGNVPKKLKLTEKNHLKSSKNDHSDTEKLQQESKTKTKRHQSDDEDESYFDVVLIKEEDENDVICLLDQTDEPYENMLQNCDVVSVTDDKTKIALLRAEVRNLRLELEQVKTDHREEIIKLKEIQEKQQLEIRRLQRKLCENCQQEAKFHCCKSTFYCNEDCQKKHWATVHRSYCERKIVGKVRQASTE